MFHPPLIGSRNWQGADPAFSSLFHENPACRTSVTAIPNIVFFPNSASLSQILANPASRVGVKSRMPLTLPESLMCVLFVFFLVISQISGNTLPDPVLMFIIRSCFYRHALADVFQVADFFIIWLHPRAGKMKGVLHSDWLPLGLSTSCSRFSKKFPVISQKVAQKTIKGCFL